MEVMVVSAHSPTLAGRREIRSVPGRSSLNTGSGGGCHRSAEALPIDLSEAAANDLLATGPLLAGLAVLVLGVLRKADGVQAVATSRASILKRDSSVMISC